MHLKKIYKNYGNNYIYASYCKRFMNTLKLGFYLSINIILFSCKNNGKLNNEAKMQVAKTESLNNVVEPIASQKKTLEEFEKFETENPKNRQIPIPVISSGCTFPILVLDDYSSNNTLEEVYQTIEVAFQEFNIDTRKDTTISCNEGTIIKIKALSFLNQSTSEEVTTEVIFKVKEFYKISDILAARLTTQSNGSILETGGMLFLEAFSNGKPCILKKTAPIEISFPHTEKKDSMILFEGNKINNNINWQPMPLNAKKETTSTTVFVLASVSQGNSLDFLSDNFPCPDYTPGNGNTPPYRISFVINENGKAENIAIDNLNNDSIKKIALKVVADMPAWKPEIKNGIAVKSNNPYSILFDCNDASYNGSTFKKGFELKTNDSNINNEKVCNIINYFFRTTNLGWLNYDRFYNSSKPLTDVYVDCGAYSEIDVRLVFHSFNGLLLPSFNDKPTTFNNIPSSEPITIVAIKKLDGETYIAVVKSNTKFETINNMVFEKVTMEKLKEKLTVLNSIWK
jgi:hypothetical protein